MCERVRASEGQRPRCVSSLRMISMNSIFLLCRREYKKKLFSSLNLLLSMGESFLFSSDLISRSIAGHAPVDESGWKARGVQELPCFPVIFLSFSTFASVSLQHNGNGCKRRHHRERLFCNLCSSTLPNLTECGNIGGQNAIITRFLP